MSKNKTKNQKLTELLIVALLVGGALLLFMWGGDSAVGAYGRVTIDGEEVMRIPLDQPDGTVVDMNSYGVPVHFMLEGGRIRFYNVTCPDHICEQTGLIGEEGQTAVCMPNRTALQVVKSEE